MKHYMPKWLFFALAVMTVSACAASGAKTRQHRPASAVEQPQQLLTHARRLQAEKGCRSAIPAYRVIAGFGEGYDVAQFELGACLLMESGVNDVETALFTQEAAFWLTRAAWAGNARAQLRLATALSGARPENETIRTAPAEAMGWALVYEANSARALYGLASVPAPVMAHLNAALDKEALNAAKHFAENFEPVVMAAFSAPRRENAATDFQRRQPQDGRQKRRR
jgi:TPR repeat protein